jgi:hypothetical protein
MIRKRRKSLNNGSATAGYVAMIGLQWGSVVEIFAFAAFSVTTFVRVDYLDGVKCAFMFALLL